MYVFDSFYLIFPRMGLRSTVFFSESLVFCQQKNKRVIPWEKMNNLLFFKERLWAIRSCCSWQNIDGTDLLFFRSNLLPLLLTKESGRNWLFFHKKLTIQSKNQRENSLPWVRVVNNYADMCPISRWLCWQTFFAHILTKRKFFC